MSTPEQKNRTLELLESQCHHLYEIEKAQLRALRYAQSTNTCLAILVAVEALRVAGWFVTFASAMASTVP